MGVVDPATAVILRTRKLLEEAGFRQAPYPLDGLARRQRVLDVRHEDMIADGLLEPVPGGFVIRLNRKMSPHRHRFTFAHEIAHTFFREVSEGSVVSRRNGGFQFDPQEERLCDIAATEMLLPEQQFAAKAFAYGPSVSSIYALSSEFDASTRAVAIRLCEMSFWKMAVSSWKLGLKGWVKQWATRSTGFPRSFYDWSVQGVGLIQRALEKGYATGYELLGSAASLCEKAFVEARRIGQKVLAVFLIDLYPEFLVQKFRGFEGLEDPVWGSAQLQYI